MIRFLSRLITRMGASLFFLGYVPPMPGTLGSACAVAALWWIHAGLGWTSLPEWTRWYWFGIVAVSALSVLLSNRAVELFGREDPPQVIIDEVAGQLVTFIMIPLSWRTLVLGFVLFRFFDIIKPYPVYKMEDLDDGVGVTLDDIAAGVWANVTLSAILFVYHSIKGAL
jgi:phosphatidylglycerophosphatase A